jgi:aromatase
VAAQTENSIRIHAPFTLVWSMTNDLVHWPELFSEYAAVDIVHHEGDTVRFRLTMHPDENGKVWSWVSERTMDRAARTVQAHRVETGPFEYMRIKWTYRAEGEYIRMTWYQDFQMKPEAPVDDEGMRQRINTNSKIQMELIRDKVEAASRGRDGEREPVTAGPVTVGPVAAGPAAVGREAQP